MEEWLALLSGPVKDLGAVTLLSIVVLMILTGRLAPASVVKLWQEAYFKERDGREVRDRQITDLIEANRVAVRALDALPAAASHHQAGGDRRAREAEDVAQRSADEG